jgi:hypothetical protein
MGKKDVDVSMEDDEEESVAVLSPIAVPLAKDKLVKKILKLVKAGEHCPPPGAPRAPSAPAACSAAAAEAGPMLRGAVLTLRCQCTRAMAGCSWPGASVAAVGPTSCIQT